MVASLLCAPEKPIIVTILYILSVELNLSATESALTIVSHYRPFPSHDPKALRVCLMQNLCISAFMNTNAGWWSCETFIERRSAMSLLRDLLQKIRLLLKMVSYYPLV